MVRWGWLLVSVFTAPAWALSWQSACAVDAAKAAVATEARRLIQKLPESQVDSGMDVIVKVPAPAKLDLKSTVNGAGGSKDLVYDVGLGADSSAIFYTVVTREAGANRPCKIIGVDADK